VKTCQVTEKAMRRVRALEARNWLLERERLERDQPGATPPTAEIAVEPGRRLKYILREGHYVLPYKPEWGASYAFRFSAREMGDLMQLYVLEAPA